MAKVAVRRNLFLEIWDNIRNSAIVKIMLDSEPLEKSNLPTISAIEMSDEEAEKTLEQYVEEYGSTELLGNPQIKKIAEKKNPAPKASVNERNAVKKVVEEIPAEDITEEQINERDNEVKQRD